MVDVIQVPVYPDIPLFLYFVIGWIIFLLIGIAVFLLVFFKRDFKKIKSELRKVKSRVGEEDHTKKINSIYDSFKDLQIEVKDYEKNHIKDMVQLKEFIASDTKVRINALKRGVKAETRKNRKKLNEKLSSFEKRLDRMHFELMNDINKKYSSFVSFYIMRIMDEMRDEEDRHRIGKLADDMRTFVKYNKKMGAWGRGMEGDVSKFLKEMEASWNDKSKEVSLIYSMLDEEVRSKS